MNLSHIQLFVFDMAGTTVNEQNVVYKTLQTSISKHIEVELDTVLLFGAGKEKHQAIKDILAFKNVTHISSEAIFEDFKNELNKAYETLDVLPIEGVEEVLLQLIEQNKKVVLNTGYNSKVANTLLQKLNWEQNKHYHFLITADDVELGRPEPYMIYKAMNLTNVLDTNFVLKAGDSGIDIEEGKNANCAITIGVLSGAQTEEQIRQEKPTLILNSLKELTLYL